MMMKNYGEGVEIIHIRNWSYLPDYHYKILIIGNSVSGKTNLLLNLININDQMLVKFICMSMIHLNQSINY